MPVVKKHINPETQKPGECVAQIRCEYEGSPHFFWDTTHNHAVLPPHSAKQTELDNTPLPSLHEQQEMIARNDEERTRLEELYNSYLTNHALYTQLMEDAQSSYQPTSRFLDQVKSKPTVIGSLEVETPSYETTAQQVPAKTAARIARAFVDSGKDEQAYRSFISSCFV